MATIAHSTLTGTELHEPKGVSTATVGQVYVANGSGSGTWTSLDATAFTGVICDFLTPVAPSGWLELDGSVISTSTYAGLYAVMTIQQNGTRTNGSPTITSLPSTTGIKAGYFVFGTGITSGTTVLSVDSSSQITMSANAGSSGTNTVIVSPWLLNTGTIKLPDLATAGRYRRARTSGQAVGVTQADSFASHTHTASTGTESAAHAHTYSGTTSGQSIDHSHGYTVAPNQGLAVAGGGTFGNVWGLGTVGATTTGASIDHSHTYSGTSATENANHTHAVTVNNAGSTETRPISIVCITCIKT